MKMPPQDKIALELYEAAARHRAEEKKRGYLGMSEVGHPCERKIWFLFRGITPLPLQGRSVMIFRFGDHIEADIIDWLLAAGYKVEGQQGAFSDHCSWFSGHCDGIIYGITQKAHILEIKSAKDKKFKSFKGFGVQKTYQVYYDQAQLYMGYSGLERALFIVQNKDTCEIHTERLYFDQVAFEALKEKAYKIITANKPIDAPFVQESYNCTWCDYKVACWSPELALNDRVDCMTCVSMSWHGLSRWCRNPAHSFEIHQRVGACPDWRSIV